MVRQAPTGPSTNNQAQSLFSGIPAAVPNGHTVHRQPATPPTKAPLIVDNKPPAVTEDLSPPTESSKHAQPSLPTLQPAPTVLAPAPSSANELSDATQAERRQADHAFGLDCTIRTRQSIGHGHRIQHPQLY